MMRLVLVGALALAATGQAFAADIPPPVAPPPRAPAVYVPTIAPIYNWSGIYIGVNGGFGFGQSQWTAGPLATDKFNINGGLVGGTLGANFQAGQFVFGVETDLDYSTIKGSSNTTNLLCANCQTSDSWLGTTRARLGFAWDRVLFFGTGGVAYGDVKATPPAFGGVAGGTDTSTQVGWTAGAGLEFALAQNWTAKIDYLYVKLQNGACTAACGNPLLAVPVSFNANLVRAGVNFKFNVF